MATRALNCGFAGSGDATGHTNTGNAAWGLGGYWAEATPCLGTNNDTPSVFRFDFDATFTGATINGLTFRIYFRHNFTNTNYNACDCGPYHTNGQGDPVADAIANYATSFGYAADVNQYVTNITTYRSAHDQYIDVTLPAQALTDFAAAIAASSVFTLYLQCSGGGTGIFLNDCATDPNPPQLIVDYTAGAGGGGPFPFFTRRILTGGMLGMG